MPLDRFAGFQTLVLLTTLTCLTTAFAQDVYETCSSEPENVATNSSPVTGRNIAGTGLCGSFHCCEFVLGGRPNLHVKAGIAGWTVIAVFGVLGIVLWGIATCLRDNVDNGENGQRTPNLTCLVIAASCGMMVCLGIDVLAYQLVVVQVAYGRQWSQSLKPLLIAFMAVDGVTAVVSCICSIWFWDLGNMSVTPSAVDKLRCKSVILAIDIVVKSIIYGLVSLCVLVVIPRRILYDGVSGTYFSNVNLVDQGYNITRLD